MTEIQHQGYVNRRVLKLNVGFLLSEGIGYQRVIDLDIPRIQVADDLELDYLKGDLRLSRNSRGILIQSELETSIVSECARCLTTISVPVTFKLEELFSYPPDPDADYSVDDTGILDLAPLLREEAILAIPMGVLCRSECAGLCPQCGQNWNEGPCECDQDEIDPRLSILRNYRDPKNDE